MGGVEMDLQRMEKKKKKKRYTSPILKELTEEQVKKLVAGRKHYNE